MPDNMVSNIFLNCAFLLFKKCIDPTRIILAPINADITVGENATMQCAASFDPALDLTFIWSFNGYVIDFNKENIHYQRNFMVCALSFILLTFQRPLCVCTAAPITIIIYDTEKWPKKAFHGFPYINCSTPEPLKNG